MGRKLSFMVGTLLCTALFSVHAKVITTQVLAGFGSAKYPQNFQHFDYVNPNAPKYGKATFAVMGTYDNFNRFASRGVAAAGVTDLYDTLMYLAKDEVNTAYPLIARQVRYADDYSWAEVALNPDARFHDGVAITAADVAFTFNKLMTQGVPQYRVYYKTIQSVTAVTPHQVKITMKTADREKLFSFIQTTPVLPKHFWQDKDLSQPLKHPPIGSGPYLIDDYKLGQYVHYKLDEDYWAAGLAVNRGRHNFKQVRYDYYRDDTVMLEAFKAGEFDVRQESSAKFWATAYHGVHFEKGFITKQEIAHPHKPAGAQGFVFNTKRPIFQDVRIREALNYALDFEWMNKNMFYGQYTRTRSYFQNTAYEASGLPDEQELKELKPFRETLPPRLFKQSYNPPVTNGSGRIRQQIRQALALLKQAGWVLKSGILREQKTNKPFVFELLIYSPVIERIAVPLQKNLKRLGIKMNIRMVDTAQYIKRLRDRDFDMVSSQYAENLFPNSNLLIAWHSHYLDSTYNTAGVADPTIDHLTQEIAKSQDDPARLLALGRALDRVLQWQFYMIPQWHNQSYRVAMWDKFERPQIVPKYDLGLDTWWISAEKSAKLPEKRR